ncbi:chorismate mutase [Erwinia psidii]|uniref:Chorismate mutase n=1 Tax=Erwinia psidii TaxID=69224 RepID=A0A3N6V4D4_9GAMM|nr:chorismate mutase [Erwinia psidii]MCX8956644.1 chorismate mutase [Erwinia psidii]MCX8961446.1 chorismate mutase [Erwinia psidii]MCX8965086.1 chorismate mutase [Erwinia psidii]RQM39975.1 chorismate mutase [Erwinia psidii]
MKSKMTLSMLLSAGLFISASAMAASTAKDDIALLINQRLSYMKDVAGYKAKNHLAIEDLTQEGKVLSGSVAIAEKLGLNGGSVKPFIQAQMDAAKAIQYRYRADWLSETENGWQPAPLDQVRAKISALNTDILTDISANLKQGVKFTDKNAFMQAINQPNLKPADKERLWRSLGRITLNQ